MAKVIVERPRTGGGISFPRRRPDCDRLEMEQWKRREGIGRPWRSNRKWLNENLAPLRRYLQSQVGRPWNKVYSEICQHMNRRSAVQLHIWQHLMQFVSLTPRAERAWRSTDFIVHPRTGLLIVNPNRWHRTRSAPQANPDRVFGKDDIQYHRLDGVWYGLRLTNVPRIRFGYDFGFRQHLSALSDTALQEFYGRYGVYGSSKWQLNKKEIRRLGLGR